MVSANMGQVQAFLCSNHTLHIQQSIIADCKKKHNYAWTKILNFGGKGCGIYFTGSTAFNFASNKSTSPTWLILLTIQFEVGCFELEDSANCFDGHYNDLPDNVSWYEQTKNYRFEWHSTTVLFEEYCRKNNELNPGAFARNLQFHNHMQFNVPEKWKSMEKYSLFWDNPKAALKEFEIFNIAPEDVAEQIAAYKAFEAKKMAMRDDIIEQKDEEMEQKNEEMEHKNEEMEQKNEEMEDIFATSAHKREADASDEDI